MKMMNESPSSLNSITLVCAQYFIGLFLIVNWLIFQCYMNY